MDSLANQASRSARREAARQARNAFPPMGIYAIRDRVNGHLLLGASRNVHAALNRARFELRMGKYADCMLQAEWNRSGVDGLAFEVLELVKEREDVDFDYAGELKALEQIYRELQGLAP
ncbi:MAG: GIY-YIG nuclease family protein [Ramlibacter sp.]|nr:GIY-YIG nuclease family protein [Ramlibacter sp.]